MSASITPFFVDALSGALDLGLATPDDVLKHVTPDVLAASLPRALWAKLLRACLDAPRVDAALVVKTLGIPDLCACVPGSILWSIVADVATRALGKGLVASPPPPAVTAPASGPVPVAVPATASAPVPVAASAPVSGSGPTFIRPATSPGTKIPDVKPSTPTPVPPVASPPPNLRTSEPPNPPASSRAPTITTTQTAAPKAEAMVVDIDFEDDEPAPLEAPPARTTAPTPVPRGTQPGANGGPRAGSGAGASSRRPQANAGRPGSRTSPPSSRRASANSDFDLDTDVSNASKDVPVDDDQLIDWTSSEETQTSDQGPARKR